MTRPHVVKLIGVALLVGCLAPACARDATAPPQFDVAEVESLDPQSGSMAPCDTHCDCLQGEFCYKGTCVRDETFPVYCCAKEGCPPGAQCVTTEGTSSRCGEDPEFACDTACDCGPAHACLDVPDVGRTCVKDDDDPWLEGPTMYEVVVPDGEATYCVVAWGCYAGAWEYASAGRTDFLAYDPWTGVPRDACGGPACMYAGDCDGYDVCVDTRPGAEPLPHVSCHPAGGYCVPAATAEAVYGFSSYDIVRDCDATVTPGALCEAGWREGGSYAVEAVLGEAGACGDGTCDAWESPVTCSDDCACGDAVCSSTEFVAGSCVVDCGTCGDGICGALESHKSCPGDCPDLVDDGCCTPRDVVLGAVEDCPCFDSVEHTDDRSVCGDGACQRDGRIPEHYGNCPSDCSGTTVELEAVVLVDQLDLLRQADAINRGQYRALERKVSQVVELMERHQPDEALVVLDGFETQVRSFVDDVLSDHQAAPLLAIAGGIAELIGLDTAPPSE